MSQEDKLPDGYAIPIHRSLIRPILWMGVPRTIFIGNLLFILLGSILLKTWTVLFVGIASHFLFKYLTSKDHQFFDIFLRAKKHKLYYYR